MAAVAAGEHGASPPWSALDLALLRTAAFVCGVACWAHPAFDPDVGWHLMGGSWIAAHHAPPRADFINSFNPFWHDYHWLAQWAMYELYRAGGYALLKLGFGARPPRDHIRVLTHFNDGGWCR